MTSPTSVSTSTDARARLKASLPAASLTALEFDESQYVNRSVGDDPFYTLQDLETAEAAAPGSLLKLEENTNTSLYALPPATALSRFVFQSENFNGAPIPVSAFILWPFAGKRQPDGLATVVWAHGTSGSHRNCAPSNTRKLWQHFLGPYQLALQGYAVVAPDYAGLGVAKDADGKDIVHEYLASPSQANDVIYSVVAAQKAFPKLSKQFVVIGHSLGGGAAWAVAQRQALNPQAGYLGSIAVSPVTKVLDLPGSYGPLIGLAMLYGVRNVFPDFDLSEVLTPEGTTQAELLRETGGGIGTWLSLLLDRELLKHDWRKNKYLQQWQALSCNGGKTLGGPLLVIHGDTDFILDVKVTTAAVEETAERFPDSAIEYITLPHVSHQPAMTASQCLWMEWIEDRFAGKKVQAGCKSWTLQPERPIETYQKEVNWFLEMGTEYYHTA